MSTETPRNAHAGQIRRFLLENYLFTTEESALADDDSLLQRGIVDSTGMMELIAFIETEFGIVVSDTEMVPENLDSVDAIAHFVERRRGPAPLQAGGWG